MKDGRLKVVHGETAASDWLWSTSDPIPAISDNAARHFVRAFQSPDGRAVLDHLEQSFATRRVPPSASDAVLRHVEGQRSVVAHIQAMIKRGSHDEQ